MYTLSAEANFDEKVHSYAHTNTCICNNDKTMGLYSWIPGKLGMGIWGKGKGRKHKQMGNSERVFPGC